MVAPCHRHTSPFPPTPDPGWGGMLRVRVSMQRRLGIKIAGYDGLDMWIWEPNEGWGGFLLHATCLRRLPVLSCFLLTRTRTHSHAISLSWVQRRYRIHVRQTRNTHMQQRFLHTACRCYVMGWPWAINQIHHIHFHLIPSRQYTTLWG